MKKYISFLICFQFFFALRGQTNLILNAGFETYTTCPSMLNEISLAQPWFVPTEGTSDLFNSCASISSPVNIPQTFLGQCTAHTGSGMAGLYAAYIPAHAVNKKYREYIGVKLSSALVNNQKYYVTFYVRLAPYTNYAIKSFGMLLSKDSIVMTTDTAISGVPQVAHQTTTFITSKTSWTKISGSFVATGVEKFAYIGNFNSTVTNDTLPVSNAYIPTSYYFVDDICLSTNSVLCSSLSGINETGFNEANFNEMISTYPSPTQNLITIKTSNNQIINSLILTDIAGTLIFVLNDVDKEEYQIDLTSIKDGLYFLTVSTGGTKILKRIVKN